MQFLNKLNLNQIDFSSNNVLCHTQSQSNINQISQQSQIILSFINLILLSIFISDFFKIFIKITNINLNQTLIQIKRPIEADNKKPTPKQQKTKFLKLNFILIVTLSSLL